MDKNYKDEVIGGYGLAERGLSIDEIDRVIAETILRLETRGKLANATAADFDASDIKTTIEEVLADDEFMDSVNDGPEET